VRDLVIAARPAEGGGEYPYPPPPHSLPEPCSRLGHPLTELYNERPTWLDIAHRKLDAAVAAAYGWPADLTDDAILERLLALNLERGR
jgi:hypothetical protein